MMEVNTRESPTARVSSSFLALHALAVAMAADTPQTDMSAEMVMFRVLLGIFKHLLAEDVRAHQDDRSDHPGHENAGDADGKDLAEQDFRAQEHQAGFDCSIRSAPRA